jgi:hypothetical protein
VRRRRRGVQLFQRPRPYEGLYVSLLGAGCPNIKLRKVARFARACAVTRWGATHGRMLLDAAAPSSDGVKSHSGRNVGLVIIANTTMWMARSGS